MAALAVAAGPCGSIAAAAAESAARPEVAGNPITFGSYGAAAAVPAAAVPTGCPAALAGDRGSKAAVAAGPALTEHHQPPIISAMLRRADRSGRAAENIGLLDFVDFCASRTRRLMMLLPDGVVDVVSAFASPSLDSTWSMELFQRLVVAVVSRDKVWFMASYCEAF